MPEISRSTAVVVMSASAAFKGIAALAFAALAPSLRSIELNADSNLVIAGVVCTTAMALIIQFIIRLADIFGDDPEDSNPKKGRPGNRLLPSFNYLCCAPLVLSSGKWMNQAAKVEIPGSSMLPLGVLQRAALSFSSENAFATIHVGVSRSSSGVRIVFSSA